MTTVDHGRRKPSSATVVPATTNQPATSATLAPSIPENAAPIAAAGSNRCEPLIAAAAAAPPVVAAGSGAGSGPPVAAAAPLGCAWPVGAVAGVPVAIVAFGGRYAPGRGAPFVPFPGPPYG